MLECEAGSWPHGGPSGGCTGCRLRSVVTFDEFLFPLLEDSFFENGERLH